MAPCLYFSTILDDYTTEEKGLLRFKSNFPSATLVFVTMDNYLEFEKHPEQFLENHPA